jgi:hypothetical protein
MARFEDLEDFQHAHQELLDAGLSREELARHYAAEIDLGKCTVRFRRRKECWSIRASIGLPYEIAQKLNSESGKGIRARGDRTNSPLKEGEAVLFWEVDDAEAFRTLIRTLKDHFLIPASAN